MPSNTEKIIQLFPGLKWNDPKKHHKIRTISVSLKQRPKRDKTAGGLALFGPNAGGGSPRGALVGSLDNRVGWNGGSRTKSLKCCDPHAIANQYRLAEKGKLGIRPIMITSKDISTLTYARI